jgi:hypothetical protein
MVLQRGQIQWQPLQCGHRRAGRIYATKIEFKLCYKKYYFEAAYANSDTTEFGTWSSVYHQRIRRHLRTFQDIQADSLS